MALNRRETAKHSEGIQSRKTERDSLLPNQKNLPQREGKHVLLGKDAYHRQALGIAKPKKISPFDTARQLRPPGAYIPVLKPEGTLVRPKPTCNLRRHRVRQLPYPVAL